MSVMDVEPFLMRNFMNSLPTRYIWTLLQNV